MEYYITQTKFFRKFIEQEIIRKLQEKNGPLSTDPKEIYNIEMIIEEFVDNLYQIIDLRKDTLDVVIEIIENYIFAFLANDIDRDELIDNIRCGLI